MEYYSECRRHGARDLSLPLPPPASLCLNLTAVSRPPWLLSSDTPMNPPPLSPPPTLLRLFQVFLRLGLTAFGGPAMIAYIRELAVERERWLGKETFADGVALSQTIPGATAMQVAACVGLRTRGVAGALVSYIGFGLPAFFLMLTLSVIYGRAHTLPLVIAAFSGLQALIVAVVANAAITFGRNTLHCRQQWGIALLAALLFGMMVNPVLILLLAALLGMILLQEGHPGQTRTDKESTLPPIFRPLGLLLAGAVSGLALLALLSPGLARLALLMIKIDLFAFGGGFGSVPLMFHEIVEVRAWLDGPTFLDGIALGQFTPGPIVITATFVGYLLHGLIGAGVATVAIFCPSLLLVIGLTPYFDRLRSSSWFNRAITGVLSSFVGLLAAVTIRFALQVHWDWPHLLLATAALAALLKKVDILRVFLAGLAVSVLCL
jgi:chromate transporter